MALDHRDSTGVGQFIECPQLAAGLFAMSDVISTQEGVSRGYRLDRERNGYDVGYRLYRTADGWLFVCCPDEETRERFLRSVGSAPEEWFDSRTTSECLISLGAAGVPAEAVREWLRDELLDDPEMIRSGRVASYRHPTLGIVRQPAGFIRFSDAACVYRGPTPLLGQHTREVLREIGFTEDEIDELRAERVVAWPADSPSG